MFHFTRNCPRVIALHLTFTTDSGSIPAVSVSPHTAAGCHRSREVYLLHSYTPSGCGKAEHNASSLISEQKEARITRAATGLGPHDLSVFQSLGALKAKALPLVSRGFLKAGRARGGPTISLQAGGPSRTPTGPTSFPSNCNVRPNRQLPTSASTPAQPTTRGRPDTRVFFCAQTPLPSRSDRQPPPRRALQK